MSDEVWECGNVQGRDIHSDSQMELLVAMVGMQPMMNYARSGGNQMNPVLIVIFRHLRSDAGYILICSSHQDLLHTDLVNLVHVET